MQKTMALSTAEVEYYSASEMAVEIIYLRNLIRNMGLPQEDDTPVYEDDTACIEWDNHIIGGRERAKHIDIRKHFAHEANMLIALCAGRATSASTSALRCSLHPNLAVT